ncbi:MAG: hypothetical protein ACYTAO_14720 [Planctomycetota bacterium]|jgi:hypothetical protein
MKRHSWMLLSIAMLGILAVACRVGGAETAQEAPNAGEEEAPAEEECELATVDSAL